MSTVEALKMEETNDSNICLVRLGFLWYANERSAYRLMKYMPDFVPLKRPLLNHGRVTNKDACFIRFPQNRLDEIKGLMGKNTPLVIREQTKDSIVITGNEHEADEVSRFGAWRNRVAFVQAPQQKVVVKHQPTNHVAEEQNHKPESKTKHTGTVGMNEHIVQKIMNYQVANKTPLETMQFVISIQELLKV
ncbi:MAG: hypothetical protein ACYDCN_09485 [Bacteroidia bacterium]